MAPLRIVQINTVDVAGGAAKVARKLHEKYRERGHESTLVVGWKQSADPDVVEIDNTDAGRGIRGRALRILEARGRQYLDHPGSHRIPALAGGEWDVVHAHNLHGGYFDLAPADERHLSQPVPDVEGELQSASVNDLVRPLGGEPLAPEPDRQGDVPVFGELYPDFIRRRRGRPRRRSGSPTTPSTGGSARRSIRRRRTRPMPCSRTSSTTART